MIVETLKNYTPEQIKAAKENTAARGMEDDTGQGCVRAILRAIPSTARQRWVVKSTVEIYLWEDNFPYDGTLTHRLHPDAEPPEPTREEELVAKVVKLVAGWPDWKRNALECSLKATNEASRKPMYPPLPEDPTIGKRYTLEEGKECECMASVGGCTSLTDGSTPDCMLDRDGPGGKIACEICELCSSPERRFVSIPDADAWHAKRAAPPEETQPGEWEECEVTYEVGQPSVNLPTWHPHYEIYSSVLLSTAQWLLGFGGVQYERQKNKDEWNTMPQLTSRDGDLDSYDSGVIVKRPASVTKARFMRMTEGKK